MVIGFDKFRSAFHDFAENYIVIGGSACDWLFASLNAQFRATKDIDLVVVAEKMSPAFAAALWAFIKAGGYSAYERKDGKKCFYRFLNPTAEGYPFMLEFFAREPIGFPSDGETVIVPIPVEDDDISSLSGILMDEGYYSFIKGHRIEIDGVSLLPAEALLVLKARAWVDLSSRKARGEFVKDKDIRKHRTDILRLQAQIVEGTVVKLEEPLKAGMREFVEVYEAEPIDPRTIGVPGSFTEAIARIRQIFGVGESTHD